MNTRSQKLAMASFSRVELRAKQREQESFQEYASFAKKFPALIHSCGLAQAVAFAQAKGSSKGNSPKPEAMYLDDLAKVLQAAGHNSVADREALAETTRSAAQLSVYLRLSRDALDAAAWLKRYVEAVAEA